MSQLIAELGTARSDVLSESYQWLGVIATEPHKVRLTSTHSRHQGCSGLGTQVISKGDEDISGESRDSVKDYVEKVKVRSATYGPANVSDISSIVAPTV